MTRVWIAFGLIGVILTLAFTEYNLCRGTSEQLLEITKKIEETDNPDIIIEYCNQMRQIWDSRKSVLEIFLYHSEADTIDNSIETIRRLAEYENTGTIYTECGLLTNQLLSLKETEEVYPHNIL